MGELIDLNPKSAIADADIPVSIARDTEVVEAVATHVTETDPHTQYLLQSEGDARYLGISNKATDSELVDGIDSSCIVFGSNWSKAIGQHISVENVFTTSGFIDCYLGGGVFPPGTAHISGFQTRHGNSDNLWGMQAACQHNINNEFYFRTVSIGAFQPWRRIWNNGNFDPNNHSQVFTPSVKALCYSGGEIVGWANYCGLEVVAENPSCAAFMSFHRPGEYAFHFGLDTDNQLKIGGWSLGANSYKIWHEGNLNKNEYLLKAEHEASLHSVNCTLIRTVVAPQGYETVVSIGDIPGNKIVQVTAQILDTSTFSETFFIIIGGGGEFAPTPRLVSGAAIRIPSMNDTQAQFVGKALNILVWHTP